MSQTKKYQFAVVGAGFYGCSIALELKKNGYDVAIFEKGTDILTRASYNNQARVHNGYHYPINITTALRSRINFPQFVKQYASCIYKDFTKYYAIAKERSDVSVNQFLTFCERIGAPAKEAPEHIRALFNSELIENIFEVQEYSFNAGALRALLHKQIENAGIPVHFETEAKKIIDDNGALTLKCIVSGHDELLVEAQEVFNCTYAQLNEILHESHLPIIPLKSELTEMALVEMPEALKKVGVTVMAGPFFSFMPFPSKPGLHTVSHVRYTPHSHWVNRGYEYIDPYSFFNVASKESNYPKMLTDIARYFPSIESCTYRDSLWEIKTTLMINEKDKGRPILYLPDCGVKGFHCIMGGKMDNIYDILEILTEKYPPQ